MSDPKFRRLLTHMFPDSGEVHILCMDAGLPTGRFAMGVSPEQLWVSVLNFAENSGRYSQLLDTIAERYPENDHLRDAIQRERRRWEERQQGLREDRDSSRAGNGIPSAETPASRQQAVNQEESPASPAPIKILFLAANPLDTTPLTLDQEIHEIDEGLRRARGRDRFVLTSRWAVRPLDLSRALLDENPTIVHFAGHGSRSGMLKLDGGDGISREVPIATLAHLFSLMKDQVRCVVLNACYSAEQAKAIGAHIDYVIGTTRRVEDNASIHFSTGFYDALGAGKSYAEAYAWACAVAAMLGSEMKDPPQLFKRSGL